MKKLLILTLFSSLFVIFSFGKGNEKYIKEGIKDFDKFIRKGAFVNGTIYFKSDTIEVQMIDFKGNKRMYKYLCCISKSTNDSIIIFYPNDIVGYRVNGDNYISHNSNGSEFFIKQIGEGEIDLYERSAIPIDNRFLYYLKKQKSHSYFVINPLENNISVYNLPDSSKPASPVATKVHFESKGLTEKFKIFVSRHLGDCTKVTNMVKSDFYTINDLPMIVETYNNCFE